MAIVRAFFLAVSAAPCGVPYATDYESWNGDPSFAAVDLPRWPFRSTIAMPEAAAKFDDAQRRSRKPRIQTRRWPKKRQTLNGVRSPRDTAPNLTPIGERMTRFGLSLLAIVAVPLLASVPSLAQDRAGFAPPAHRFSYEGTPVDGLPTPFSHGGTCVKLCEYDNTPCDPDYWKIADRRCNFNQKGSY